MLREGGNPSGGKQVPYRGEGQLSASGRRIARSERTFWPGEPCAFRYTAVWDEGRASRFVPRMRPFEDWEMHLDRRSLLSVNVPVVLCIDDCDATLQFFRQHLESHGYCALTALNGRDGLKVLQTYPVDVLVVDFQMPEMDGEAVARAVRRLYPKLPIVLASGGQADEKWPVPRWVDASVSKEEMSRRLVEILDDLLQLAPDS
jgi:CheY-like chemotaxis protein